MRFCWTIPGRRSEVTLRDPPGSWPTEVNSVAWLLVGAKAGTATGKLADVKFIRRTETHGGVAPESGCQSTGDAGKTARIPYTATYTFYADK